MVYSSYDLSTEGIITMLYLCIAGFTLFGLALFFLVRQEIRHTRHLTEMRDWATKVLRKHANLVETLRGADDLIEILEDRCVALEQMRDYLTAANEEIYSGYVDAARTIDNMEASVVLLDELLTQAENAGIENAKRILGGVTVHRPGGVTIHRFVNDTGEEVEVPIDYYLPDQDQG